jgi:hypothetical protein
MLLRIALEAPQEEAAMPKPYSILAAAFLANGRNLSTAIILASSDRADRPTRRSDDRFAGPDRLSSLDFESAFARDPSAERSLANGPALAA